MNRTYFYPLGGEAKCFTSFPDMWSDEAVQYDGIGCFHDVQRFRPTFEPELVLKFSKMRIVKKGFLSWKFECNGQLFGTDKTTGKMLEQFLDHWKKINPNAD